MKYRGIVLAVLLVAGTEGLMAQSAIAHDTAEAVKIVERYLRYVDFDQLAIDSVLFTETSVIDRAHPDDTMFIYRWHYRPSGAPVMERIEMWSRGKMDMGAYTDGKRLFRQFDTKDRYWTDVKREVFIDFMHQYDLRGPLYRWRSYAGELSYEGEYTFEGQKVNRVFAREAKIHDRYYYFEKATGLLFLTTELPTVLGEEISHPEGMVDWRAWHEFIPFRGCVLPSIESYQAGDQIVIMYHTYRYIDKNTALFTEDFHKR